MNPFANLISRMNSKVNHQCGRRRDSGGRCGLSVPWAFRWCSERTVFTKKAEFPKRAHGQAASLFQDVILTVHFWMQWMTGTSTVSHVWGSSTSRWCSRSVLALTVRAWLWCNWSSGVLYHKGVSPLLLPAKCLALGQAWGLQWGSYLSSPHQFTKLWVEVLVHPPRWSALIRWHWWRDEDPNPMPPSGVVSEVSDLESLCN